VAGLVAVVVVATIEHGRVPSDPPKRTPPPAVRSSAPGTSTTAPVTPVVVSEMGHRLLGVTAGWELFGRGPGEVVRLQLALGRITRTTVPSLQSTGPVSFVVGPDEVMIRPWDLVPGYLVPDGQPPRGLPAVLSGGGLAVPGPDPGHVWVQTEGGDRMAMALVGWDGSKTGVTVPIPASAWVTSDGGGYLLVTGTGGVYEARPDGLRRVTTGAVLAVGPTRWLTVECDDQYHCVNVVIDRANRARRVLARSVGDANAPPGVISPDGSIAAVLRVDSTGQPTLDLLDLASGTHHSLAVSIEQRWFDTGGVTWSPDSRWLFVAAANGKLLVVDAPTRRIRDLGVALPEISQVALRSAPR